ncbi:hypothetical protein AX774_g2771 [Zancudomyces culisetae]|uniref:Uncharacterized protein n=1 Tax=Zancudomyces culisetae TaxID=1213189 RepID=A0A1R1PRX7_ZANCU|nr:hypothetical protein AX774_g2771 [Zancudomyces culisetae]|eukprot:OMH83717.1 hypothetical protein AX774_g2771 [Zancudomyces culisetae]
MLSRLEAPNPVEENNLFPPDANAKYKKNIITKSKKYKVIDSALFKLCKGIYEEVLLDNNARKVVEEIHQETHDGIENTWRRTLKNVLARQCKKDKLNWETYLWKSLLAIRTMRNLSTGFSPAELLYGVKLTTPSIWSPPAEISDLQIAIQERIDAIRTELPEIREIGRIRNLKAKQNMKERYDKHVEFRILK